MSSSKGGRNTVTEAGQPKKRYSVPRTTTCIRCRAARAKCSHEKPTCERCRLQNAVCDYGISGTTSTTSQVVKRHRRSTSIDDDDKKLSKDSFSIGGISLPRLDNALATAQELDTYLTAFFNHVDRLPGMGFIHRAKLNRQIKERRAAPILIKAICGIATRFLPSADPHHVEGGKHAETLMKEVKYTIITETEKFSAGRLAAVLCLVNHEFNCGRSGGAWILVAVAARIAFALGMDEEITDSEIPWVEKETRRRLMWSTYFADCICSSGFRKYATVPLEAINAYLPSDDTSFQLGHGQDGPRLQDIIGASENGDANTTAHQANTSLTVRWIWLTCIRDSLRDYVNHMTKVLLPPWEQHSEFEDLIRRLQRWKETLPSMLDFNIDNLHARSVTNELDALAAMHLCFESIHAVLYRTTMPTFTDSADAEFLAKAPRGWLATVRTAANLRANAITQKVQLLEKYFPDHYPSTRLYNLYIFTSLRVQLQYIAQRPSADLDQPAQSRQDRQAGFEAMIWFIEKLTKYFSSNRGVLRDIVNMMDAQGYHVDVQDDSNLEPPQTGTTSPNEVSGLLSGFPTAPAQSLSPGSFHHGFLNRRSKSRRERSRFESENLGVEDDPVSRAIPSTSYEVEESSMTQSQSSDGAQQARNASQSWLRTNLAPSPFDVFNQSSSGGPDMYTRDTNGVDLFGPLGQMPLAGVFADPGNQSAFSSDLDLQSILGLGPFQGE